METKTETETETETQRERETVAETRNERCVLSSITNSTFVLVIILCLDKF